MVLGIQMLLRTARAARKNFHFRQSRQGRSDQTERSQRQSAPRRRGPLDRDQVHLHRFSCARKHNAPFALCFGQRRLDPEPRLPGIAQGRHRHPQPLLARCRRHRRGRRTLLRCRHIKLLNRARILGNTAPQSSRAHLGPNQCLVQCGWRLRHRILWPPRTGRQRHSAYDQKQSRHPATVNRGKCRRNHASPLVACPCPA
jgi:hypothetical protein